MSKVTSADCVAAIEAWWPEFVYFGDKWKRKLKWKDGQGPARLFCAFEDRSPHGYHETWVLVLETPEGLVVRRPTEAEADHFRMKIYGYK